MSLDLKNLDKLLEKFVNTSESAPDFKKLVSELLKELPRVLTQNPPKDDKENEWWQVFLDLGSKLLPSLLALL